MGLHTVNLLPQMGSKDLDERNLEGRNLSVHKDSSKIQLHLETNVHICPIDGWRPPQCKTTIRDLIQTRTLGVCQFFEFHRFLHELSALPKGTYLEPGSLFPEKTFPCWEICALKERVF